MNYFVELEKMGLQELIRGGFVGSVQTENLTVAYTNLAAGVEIPLHHHAEEAVDIMLEGELEIQVDKSTGILRRGMISIVPSNIPHRAKAITECKVVTIFYPKRMF